MTNFHRTAIGVLLGIIVVLLIFWSMPNYPVVPHGIVLPFAGTRSAQPTTVTIYDEFDSPFAALPIGSISVMFHTTSKNLVDRDLIFEAAKTMAAAAGGNGVVINLFGFTSESTPEPLSSAVLRGQVILSK